MFLNKLLFKVLPSGKDLGGADDKKLFKKRTA
jgi:hypothetical protein